MLAQKSNQENILL